MKTVPNVTDQISSTMLSKFSEEEAFMLECNISYIANWYFGSDYIARKLFKLYSRKEKLPIVQYINYSNCVSIAWIRVKLVSNWKESMLYTKSLQVLHRKGISTLIGLKVSSLTCVFYWPELNAKAGPHVIEFCKPWNETYQWIELKEYTRKMGSFV